MYQLDITGSEIALFLVAIAAVLFLIPAGVRTLAGFGSAKVLGFDPWRGVGIGLLAAVATVAANTAMWVAVFQDWVGVWTALEGVPLLAALGAVAACLLSVARFRGAT